MFSDEPDLDDGRPMMRWPDGAVLRVSGPAIGELGEQAARLVQATGIGVVFGVPEEQANVRIIVDEMPEYGDRKPAGYALTFTSPGWVIERAEIHVLPDYVARPKYIVHEFGHVWGWGHAPQSRRGVDVMAGDSAIFSDWEVRAAREQYREHRAGEALYPQARSASERPAVLRITCWLGA
jgi:hypothetical protein